MFSKIKIAAVSAIVALGTFAAAPASADTGIYLGIGGGHYGPRAGVWVERGHVYHRPHRRICTPGRAVNKASRMGVRRAHVRGVNRNVIRVAGRQRGHHVVIRFARAPGCPVIGW